MGRDAENGIIQSGHQSGQAWSYSGVSGKTKILEEHSLLPDNANLKYTASRNIHVLILISKSGGVFGEPGKSKKDNFKRFFVQFQRNMSEDWVVVNKVNFFIKIVLHYDYKIFYMPVHNQKEYRNISETIIRL